ncbi:cytochrome d ubiquinol oxidase subunit II [Pseudonocardia spinosispora]|uniref:cytochrome d ubiquinol oxidase subunit II n=1 Tax=Pseudonocardia spinosispora TaxID=103441 RepID=UPI000414BBFA|nr:cytochrome d ubiquinol oxidase subunit II [Pseudonocardia spinosispora]
MTAIDGLALVVFVGLAAYAVLGGADFGAGLWDLSRNRPQRELVSKAMAPVWEANHVWLIFVVITLFTGFPGAFGALSRALVAPVSVALLGIVLRGAAFVFRQYGAPHGGTPVRGTALWGRVFAIASLVTPFAFGTAAGALAGGQLRPDGSAGLWRPFLEPLPLVAGLLAVSCCVYLAAVYLTRDAERIGSPTLVVRLRRRALVTGVLSGALALAALPLLPPEMTGELRGVGLPAVAVSATGGVLGLVLLWRRHHSLARVAAAAAPAGLLAGWAIALHPWVMPGAMRLTDSAAPPVIAGPVLGVLLTGLALIAPGYLFMVRVLRAQPDEPEQLAQT